MEREDAKNLILSILVIAAVLLLADCIWLHMRCARMESEIATLTQDQQKTAETVKHLEDWIATSSVEGKIKSYKKEVDDCSRSLMDRCRSLKNAAVKGYEAVKDELGK